MDTKSEPNPKTKPKDNKEKDKESPGKIPTDDEWKALIKKTQKLAIKVFDTQPVNIKCFGTTMPLSVVRAMRGQYLKHCRLPKWLLKDVREDHGESAYKQARQLNKEILHLCRHTSLSFIFVCEYNFTNNQQDCAELVMELACFQARLTRACVQCNASVLHLQNKYCGTCQLVAYCSKDCQRQHRLVHKPNCHKDIRESRALQSGQGINTKNKDKN